MAPVESSYEQPSYDWEYDYTYGDPKTQAEEEDNQIRNLKILTVLSIIVVARIVWVVCPCAQLAYKVLKVLLLKLTVLEVMVRCMRYLCSPVWYLWCVVQARVRGWDVTYYLMVRQCAKEGAMAPPAFEDYCRYRDSLPAEGRRVMRELLLRE